MTIAKSLRNAKMPDGQSTSSLTFSSFAPTERLLQGVFFVAWTRLTSLLARSILEWKIEHEQEDNIEQYLGIQPVHALVDATCAATLFAIVALGQTGPRDLFYFVVFYNVIAFSTQPVWACW